MENEKNNSHLFAIALLIVGIFLIFFMPLIFIFTPIGDAFADTGQIGDTIGGITTPFISLIGATLVYLSFREQIKANEKIQDQISQSSKEKNFEYLSREIDSLFYQNRNILINKNGEQLFDFFGKYFNNVSRLLYIQKQKEDERPGGYHADVMVNMNQLNKFNRAFEEIIEMQNQVIKSSIIDENRLMLYAKMNTNIKIYVFDEMELWLLIDNFNKLNNDIEHVKSDTIKKALLNKNLYAISLITKLLSNISLMTQKLNSLINSNG